MEKCYKIPSDTSILLYSVCMPVILIFPVFPDLQARFALCTRQHTVMKRLTLQAQFFLHILHHIEVKNNQKHGGNHPCKRTCHARHGVALFIRCNNSHHASSYKLSHTGKHRQKALAHSLEAVAVAVYHIQRNQEHSHAPEVGIHHRNDHICII